MFRFVLLLCFCCALSTLTYAQNDLMGRVFEVKTRIGLAGVSIENTKTKQVTNTDNNGRFSIKARINDIIIFKNFSYHPDTILVTDMRFAEVFLTPQGTMLDQVTIHNTSTNAPKMSGFTDPEYHGQTVMYAKDENGNNKGGLDFRLHYWNKDEKNRKKEAANEKEQQQRAQIAKVFTATNIGRYVPLKGDELEDFILLYIPKTKVYFEHDFNLTLYLDTSYKEFQKLSPEEKKGGRLFSTPPGN